MKKKILAVLMMATLALGVTACGAKPEGDLKFTVPEGFTYVESDDLYNSEGGLANFNYITTENDGSLKLFTEELMETELETSLSAQFATTIDITIDSWEDIKVDGYDALRYSMSYEYMGIPISQVQIIVDGTEKYHYLTFTEMNDAGYDDAFKACEDSLHFGE